MPVTTSARAATGRHSSRSTGRRGLVATVLAGAPEAATGATCLLAVVLVLLLDAHAFSPGFLYPLSAVAVVLGLAGGWWLVARTAVVERAGRLAPLWDLCALLGALLAAGVNAAYDSQHVVVARDPGIYTTTAQYLAHHSGLPVHVDVSGFAPGTLIASSGYGQTGGHPGSLYAQGMHGVPAIAALVDRLFGPAAMLRTDAVLGAIGLLAFYAFARLVVHRGWALVATAALALSLPQIHFTRDTYSESLGQLAVWAGLAFFVRAQRAGRLPALGLAGLVFGASMLSRTDAFLGIIAALGMVVVLTLGAGPGERRGALGRALVFAVGVAVPTVIGLRDLQRGASGYYHDLHGDLAHILQADVAGLVLAVVVVGVAWSSATARRRYDAWSRRLGAAGTALLLLAFAVLATRPLWQTTHGANSSFVAAVQRSVHQPVDGTRTYAEHTVAWVSYYFGPLTVALGLIGMSVLVWRILARRELWLLPLLALFLPVALGYFVAPSIFPDQIWAARRFLAVVMPAVLLGTVLCLEWITARRSPRASWVRPVGTVVGVLAAVATVAVPLAISRPLLRVREYVPDLRVVQDFCAAVGPHSETLAIDPNAASFGSTFAPTVVSFCRVPSGRVVMPTATLMRQEAAAAARTGRTLYVYAQDPAQLAALGLADPHPTLAIDERQWHSQLVRAPDSADTLPRRIYLAVVRPDGSLVAVPPRTV